MTPLYWLIVPLAALCGYAGAALVRRYGAPLGLVQLPNARSSHVVPTPGGGGIGVVVGGSLAGLPLALAEPVSGWALAAGLAVALLGLVDDRRPLSAPLRLGVQLLSAAVGAFAVAPGLDGPTGLLSLAVVALAVAFWLNLFNFMDGIDGLAGSEAAFILLAMLALAAAGDPARLTTEPALWMLALAAAVLAFLALNWPPARVFMGDAGSTYLGLMLALLALWCHAAGWVGLPQSLILAAAFVADGVVTLLRRLLRREKVWQAHRRHAYQILSRRFGAHLPVTLLYLGVNVALLLPLAWLAGAFPSLGWVFALAAYGVLVPALLWAGAGRATD